MTMVKALPDRQPALTVRQQQILTMIREWVDLHGYPLTVREIGAAVGLGSPSLVAHHLAVLQQRGLMRRTGRGPRAVNVRPRQPGASADLVGSQVTIPVAGAIAAGTPILADEHVEGYLTCPRRWSGMVPCSPSGSAATR